MHTFFELNHEGHEDFFLAPTLNVGAPWIWVRALFYRLNGSAFPRTAWERDQITKEVSIC
jgi:hypothetical protein